MRPLQDYTSHVFDMDGVLLQSNASKTKAFYQTALPYGRNEARRMVTFHKRAGSLSRKERWQYFFSDILGQEPKDGELEDVLERCTEFVAQGVEQAQEMPGIREYLANLAGKKYCVSGVEYNEVRRILNTHKLLDAFEGVYGGRQGVLKSEVLSRLVLDGKINVPAVYYGDTEDDFIAARAAGMDFVFVAFDSEWENWRKTLIGKDDVRVISIFSELGVTRLPVKLRIPASGQVTVRGEIVQMPRSTIGSEVTFP